MGDPASNRRNRMADAWAAAWDEGDLTALRDLLSPDYRRHTRSAPDGQGREEMLAMITATRLAFPDLTTVIDDFVEAGDRVAIRWHSVGTHTGQLLGVPPTRKTVTVTGATFSRFDGDQIVEEWVTWDPRELLSALGILSLGEE